MGVPKFIFGRLLRGEHLSSALNQGGATLPPPVAAASNIGSLGFGVAYAGTAAINSRIDIVTEGNLGPDSSDATATDPGRGCQAKFSKDGGDNYLGRATGWQDAEGGGAGSRIVALATSTRPTRVIAVDTNGDGVKDRAIFVDGALPCTAYYTDTLLRDGSTAQAWAVLAEVYDRFGPYNSYGQQLVERDGVLYLARLDAAPGIPPTAYSLEIHRSTDYGATWSLISTTQLCDGSSTVCGQGIDMIVDQQKKLAVVFSRGASAGNEHLYVIRTSDGVAWSTEVQVSGTTGKTYPTICQIANGTTLVIGHDSGGLFGRYTTAKNMGGGWTTFSPPSTAASETMPSLMQAQDGRAYLAFHDTTSEKIELNVTDDIENLGSATWTSDADVTGGTLAHTTQWPQLADIGGAIWLMCFRVDDSDAVVTFSRYWDTYSAGANEFTMGTDAFLGADGVWYTPDGSDGAPGDYWDIDSQYDYGADRMLYSSPRHPTRSTADEADWYATFALGANQRVPVDTVCLKANGIETAIFQMDDAATFDSDGGNPQVAITVSFLKQTIAAASVTGGAGVFTLGGGVTLTRHAFAGGGYWAKDATSGNVYAILDNDTTTIYVDADASAETGDLKIISAYGWATATGGTKRYVRLKIASQKTADGYYEVGVMRVGVIGALSSRHRFYVTTDAPRIDIRTVDGRPVMRTMGPRRRAWTLLMHRPTVEERDEFLGGLAAHQLGAVPFAFIPDSDVATDWALVTVSPNQEWRGGQMTMVLEEVA